MITKQQANKLRGKLKYLLELTHDVAFAGSMFPSDAQYTREDYQRAKRDFLDAISALTEEAK